MHPATFAPHFYLVDSCSSFNSLPRSCFPHGVFPDISVTADDPRLLSKLFYCFTCCTGLLLVSDIRLLKSPESSQEQDPTWAMSGHGMRVSYMFGDLYMDGWAEEWVGKEVSGGG